MGLLLLLGQTFLAREGFDNITSEEEFANTYECRGEKLVAATTYSMLNDNYYGQWLALHKPFRALEDFVQQAPEVVEQVPAKYLHFALCLHCAPEFWLNDMAIKSSMELEAHSAAHIETILSKVKAQKHVAWLYMAGEIPVTEVLPSEDELSLVGDGSGDDEDGNGEREAPRLTQSQKRLAKEMNKQMENAMAAAQAEADEVLEACVEKAEGHQLEKDSP